MQTISKAGARYFRFSLLAVASCFAGGLAHANPAGPINVQGLAGPPVQLGNVLNVTTNLPRSIIEWQKFSIGAGEATRFFQPDAASTVLNRVIGSGSAIDPSVILGTLWSNGRVFLVNPSGITFGAGSVIDTAGFLASTLGLSNADFLAGRFSFTDTPGAGAIRNDGAIATPAGGYVYLVAPSVENNGVITSPGGEIILAAGKSVELVNAGTTDLRVQITAPDNQAVNVGQLIAQGGSIGIYAGLIQHKGTANANTAVVGESGKIVFRATKDVTLEAGSRISASGPQGGSVTIQSETGTTLVSGIVEATGNQSPLPQGEGKGEGGVGKGGTIQILGERVGLIGNAEINASGETGGGTVLVGGDFQGKNPDVQNAWRTYFGPDAVVKADAIRSGDGGRVIVWADDITRYFGSLSARGGNESGNGGFAEVSGKRLLDFNGKADLGAAHGTGGNLLLDPLNITLAAVLASPISGFTPGVDQVYDFTDDVLATSIMDVRAGGSFSGVTAGTTITLQATNDILVIDPFDLATATGAGNVSLALQAGNNVGVNAVITASGTGSLSLTADDPAGTASNNVG